MVVAEELVPDAPHLVIGREGEVVGGPLERADRFKTGDYGAASDYLVNLILR
ncbi:MAG TPA: hypothetical protein VFI46_00790 [Jiangellaceae bacterium]|nr:hypothetical protein [Jiangellaceae bacterium]